MITQILGSFVVVKISKYEAKYLSPCPAMQSIRCYRNKDQDESEVISFAYSYQKIQFSDRNKKLTCLSAGTALVNATGCITNHITLSICRRSRRYGPDMEPLMCLNDTEAGDFTLPVYEY